jgi:hypothetical protein
MKLGKLYQEINIEEIEVDRDRQLLLDRHLQYFLTKNNELKTHDWDHFPALKGLDLIQLQQLGEGMGLSKSNCKVNAKSRKPLAEYQIPHAIVTRLTALLFGNGKTPLIESSDETISEFIKTWEKESGLWTKLSMARNYGGAEGSVVIGLFIDQNGKVKIDVEDAQYCWPVYKQNKLINLMIKTNPYDFCIFDNINEYHIWTDDVENSISEKTEWNYEIIPHGFDRLPYIFIKNEDILHDYDGLSDYEGNLENFDTINRLMSQTVIGVEANCDPTAVITSQEPDKIPANVPTGASVVLKLQTGDSYQLVEPSGSGASVGIATATEVIERVLQNCRVVLDEGKASGKTATELQIRETTLREHVCELKRQYGPALEFIVELMLRYNGYTNYDVKIGWPDEGPSVYDKQMQADIIVKLTASFEKLMAMGVMSVEDVKENLKKYLELNTENENAE